jgi:hypothetical protein
MLSLLLYCYDGFVLLFPCEMALAPQMVESSMCFNLSCIW